MSKLFDKFPTVYYDVQYNNHGYRYLMTNILFRLKIFNDLKANATSYYEVQLTDKDTLEILAEKVYGNPEYHWIIALTNDMTDPLFDWPMEYSIYTKFLNSKYGSFANATNQIHHYECSIARKDDYSGKTDTISYNVDFSTYNAASKYAYTTYTLDSGITIEETIRYTAVTASEFEEAENEARRKIKVIRAEFLPQILAEFDQALTDAGVNNKPAFYRSLRAY